MKKKLVLAALGLFLLAGFASSGFAQWEQTNWPTTSSYFDLYSSQDNVIALTWDMENGGTTYLSTNNGTDWTLVAADSSKDISSAIINEETIFAGTWDGMITSPVSSIAWTDIAATGAPADSAITSVANVNGTLYVSTVGAVYTLSGSGDSWTEISTGIPEDASINSFVSIGGNIFAGSDADGVFLTTDAGANWVAVNTDLGDLHISQLVTMGDKLYAVTLKDGVYSSSDNGSSWSQITLPNINCLVVADSKLYAGTDTDGIFLSENNGETWSGVVVTGLSEGTRVFSMVASGDKLVAGTSDGIWSTTISSVVTPVETDNAPAEYVLERNYPNPFNPSTTIGFSIPEAGNISLTIYNVSGQKIRTLVDAPMTSGAHRVVWDGMTDDGIRPPSGVYLYELRAGSYHDSKKLMLMK